MDLLYIIIIAVSLSMDAFSLACSIGTLNMAYSKYIMLSIIVGAFHFFMPIIGAILAYFFVNRFHIDTYFLSGVIFLYIAIQMIKEVKNESLEFDLTLKSFLLFAFGVSLDSLGVGFTFEFGKDNILLNSLVFSLTSCVFTFTGLFLGKFLNKLIGKYAIYFGTTIMILLSLVNFCKFMYF